MPGPVWLLTFGWSPIGSGEDARLVFADLKPDVRLFDCFALAPPPQPLQAQPLSNRSDTDTSPSPGSQLTRPKTVFSAPIGPDMSVGHLPAGGGLLSVPPFCVDWSCFGPSKKKQRGLARQSAKGIHLAAHDLACHYPSPAPVRKQQIPHQTNHCHRCSSVF